MRLAAGALIEKIKRDLWITHTKAEDDQHYYLDHTHAEDLDISSPSRNVRTRLYFTSESHLHTLLNVLRCSDDVAPIISDEGKKMLESTAELGYLTQIVIRLFEIETNASDLQPSYRCEILFSPGATGDPLVDKSSGLSPYTTISSAISFGDMMKVLDFGISAMSHTRPAGEDVLGTELTG
jgi:hypothetical protein